MGVDVDVTRIRVHMAVPSSKRAVAATMAGLSGDPSEFSVPLVAENAGPASEWDAFKGYDGTYYGASQGLAVEVLIPLLQSGYENQTEVFYASFYEETGEPVDTGDAERPGCNLPTWPADATYDAFLVASGLSKVEPEEGI